MECSVSLYSTDNHFFLSIGFHIVVDYSACTTGIGDKSYVPTMDAVIFALKVGWCSVFSGTTLTLLQVNFAGENAQISVMGFVKVSVVLFYKRIFIMRWFIRSSNALIGFITAFTLAILLVREYLLYKTIVEQLILVGHLFKMACLSAMEPRSPVQSQCVGYTDRFRGQ